MSGSIKIESLRTDSCSMDYFKFGRGKDVFVIIPGVSPLSVMNFADAVADAYKVLADDYTVYLFERKDKAGTPVSIEGIADDIAGALKCLGIDKATVMGASHGGMAAMMMALNHPDLVEDLVLCSTSSYVSDKRYETIDRWDRLTKAGNAEDLYMDFGENVYPKELFEQSRGVLADMAKSVTAKDLDRFEQYLLSIKGFDIRNRLKRIACPTFIACSNDDKVFGSESSFTIARYMKKCPCLEIKVYNGFGHAVYDTAPDLKDRILGFLKSAK